MALLGAFDQRDDLVLGEHLSLVGNLPALRTQRLAAGVTVIHLHSILDTPTHTHTHTHTHSQQDCVNRPPRRPHTEDRQTDRKVYRQTGRHSVSQSVSQAGRQTD